MSIIKNPVILAIIASTFVFLVMYYWYNPTCLSDLNQKKKNNKNGKKKSKEGLNETVVISSVIAGLASWYIASCYFTDKQDISKLSGGSINKSVNDLELENQNGQETGQKQPLPSNGSLKYGSMSRKSKVPHIGSDDPSRSYNLIGSGLNIPRSELNIPSVLIDFK
jgi:hypothetical protein